MRMVVSVVLALSFVIPCGCSRQQLMTLSPFRWGVREEVKEVAPESGAYKIKFASHLGADKDDLHSVGGTKRVLRQGDYIGFKAGEDGQLYAIAGEEVFPVVRKHTGRPAVYFVWSYKTNEYDEPVDFGEILATAAALFLLGALIVYQVYQGICHPNQCDEDYAYN